MNTPAGEGGGGRGASKATARHKHSTPFVMPNPPMADTASYYEHQVSSG